MDNKKIYHKKTKYVIINESGFTLVELLVSLAFLFIVVALIFSLLNNYVKSNDRLADEIELQSQGRKVISIISGKLMECQGLSRIHNKDNTSINPEYIYSQNLSVFNIENTDGNYESFVLNNNVLYYQYIADGDNTKTAELTESNILSKNVDFVVISSLDGKNLNETSFINIKINLKKNLLEYTVEQNIYLRNIK
jgi:type II secretory pathway component PulJ